MIYEAMLVPHEAPPTLREIKRALLTYDKVVLIDPIDRELIPRNSYFTAIMGMPLIGIDSGPIRPMGKALGYDERFDKTLSMLAEARSQGLVEVRTTYEQQATEVLTIGGVPTGGYPLDLRFVFWAYRAMAGSQDFLRSALENDMEPLSAELLTSSSLALSGIADSGINDIPSLPSAAVINTRDESVALTQIARARIGALIKYAGYCEQKELVPIFASSVYASLILRLLDQTRQFLSIGEHEGIYVRRSRILDLVHEEFMVDQRLDALSVSEVLRLRTSAWGNQAASRELMFQSIFGIADDMPSDSDFDRHARNAIAEYRRCSEAVVREREALALSIKCDLGTGALGGGVALTGLLSQLESPLASAGLTLAAGGMWFLERARDYVPKLREIQAQEKDMKRGAGFGLHDFYSRLPTAN